MAENMGVVGTAEGVKKEDKHIEVPSSQPNAETFDLASFIAKKVTTPVVAVTVFLDADAGKQHFELTEKRDALNGRVAELNGMPKPKLAVGEENPNVVESSKLMAQLQDITRDLAILEDRVRSSALLVELQLKDPKAGEHTRKRVQDELGEGADDDEVTEVFMTTLLGDAVVRITNAAGQTSKGPLDYDAVANLRNSLIVSENAKLISGLFEAMNLNTEWMSNIDAGFPGRGTDVAR